MGGSPRNLILAIIYTLALAAFVFTILFLALSIHVNAHEWYPPECCGGNDCHVVDSIKWEGKNIIATVGAENITVTPGSTRWKPSPDAQYHICYTNAYDAPHVYCFFIPGDA